MYRSRSIHICNKNCFLLTGRACAACWRQGHHVVPQITDADPSAFVVRKRAALLATWSCKSLMRTHWHLLSASERLYSPCLSSLYSRVDAHLVKVCNGAATKEVPSQEKTGPPKGSSASKPSRKGSSKEERRPSQIFSAFTKGQTIQAKTSSCRPWTWMAYYWSTSKEGKAWSLC